MKKQLVVPAFVLLAAVACSEPATDIDAPPSASPSSSPSPTPTAALPPGATVMRLGELDPGTYVPEVFEPPFVFELEEPGWENAFDTLEQVNLLFKPEPDDEAITIDSENPAESVEDTEARLRATDGLAFEDESAPTRVGAARGVSFAAQASQTTGISDLAEPYEVFHGDRLRFHVVDAGGITVTVIVEASDRRFAAFEEQTNRILDSVAFL